MTDSDRRLTPEPLRLLVHEFCGDLWLHDTCTEAKNPMRADSFFAISRGSNGLRKWWRADAINWCNPPYSRFQVKVWLDKAAKEARRGCEVLMLTQADVSTRWFAELAGLHDMRCLLNKRYAFSPPGAARRDSAKFGSALWYFGRYRRRFAEVFGPHGEITPGWGPFP